MVRSLVVPFVAVAFSSATALLADAGLAAQVNRERTLVGCIEHANPSSADLLLTHAGEVPASPSAGANVFAKNDATYRLTSVGRLKLDTLIGHKVRIIGRVEKEALRTGGPEPAVTPDERTGRSTEQRGGDPPMFRARAVRSIATSCSP